MEHYQEAPSQILRAIRACVTQEGEWTTDLPWMSQPALTASDRGISNRLTGRKVAKASRLFVGHKKMGVISLYFVLGVIRTFLGHAPSPGKRRGLRAGVSCLRYPTVPPSSPWLELRRLPQFTKVWPDRFGKMCEGGGGIFLILA